MTDALRRDVHRGTVAVVTGGGTGIGRAVALDLARCGADVVVCGRHPEPLEKTAAEIEAPGARALAVPADIRDEEQVGWLVDSTLERFGRIDTLVNNAGGQFTAPPETITGKGWRAVHRLAVDAAWTVTREVAVRAMIPQRSGAIFFMAFSPRRGMASMVHAGSARAALENLAAGLALEWSRFGIRTICIAAGTISTEAMRRSYPEEDRARWQAAVPLRRFGTPEEVSALIAFLASPAADAWGNEYPAPPLVTTKGTVK
jgi:citronellol/citronellal dehydrogenase